MSDIETGAEYRIDFDGSFLPNGMYIYRLIADSEVHIEKCIIAH